jgi:hypothetical protein
MAARVRTATRQSVTVRDAPTQPGPSHDGESVPVKTVRNEQRTGKPAEQSVLEIVAPLTLPDNQLDPAGGGVMPAGSLRGGRQIVTPNRRL